MRNTIDVTEETIEGPATFKIQAISPFKCFTGINKIVKLIGPDALNVADPNMQGMAVVMSMVSNLTEAQLSDLINLFLGSTLIVINGETRTATPKVLDTIFMGNPGGIIVLLANAIALNYRNFPGAFERIKPVLEGLTKGTPQDS